MPNPEWIPVHKLAKALNIDRVWLSGLVAGLKLPTVRSRTNAICVRQADCDQIKACVTPSAVAD